MITSWGTKGKITLTCEDCGAVRTVQRNTTILKKSEHPCRACSNKRNGESKRGIPSWNSGKRFEPKKVGSTYINHHGYVEVYLGKTDPSGLRKDKYYLQHRLVVEAAMDRKLTDGEIVHHIDGDKTNNKLENLYVCSSLSAHRDIHNSLESLAFHLHALGIIEFINGEYRLAPSFSDKRMELCEFREHPNVEARAILSQAPNGEGATTIPKGSRAQVGSKRTAS